MSVPADTFDPGNKEGRAHRFLMGVQSTQPVAGLTHNFYRYPARFSPQFARAAIEAFSNPGDVILDPFMGGATTLVESRALGRHALGSDINSLSVFLSRVKTTPLSDNDLARVDAWLWGLPEHLNLHRPAVRAASWQAAGYQRNLPWPIRKTIEFALARLQELPNGRQRRFVRCLLLKAGQWALDCREHIPSAGEFRVELFHLLDCLTKGMREYRRAVRENPPPGKRAAITTSIHSAAADLPGRGALSGLPKKPTLVVTSPPYPGVYVLYHRWKVQGRKESPAPFWVADCLDGQGQAHYCFGHRKQRGLKTYFNGIRDSFAGVRQLLDPSALVLQMVAFSNPEWQLRRFLDAMQEAGFDEVAPASLGIRVAGRIWRPVPGRRWFALIHDQLATSEELVLIHRPTQRS
jgi:DNA methylase